LHQRKLLIKKGAEADIYLIDWYGRKAISKVRTPKPYRHKSLDDSIRKNRTIHEGNMLSCAKMIGIRSPFIYFIDPVRAEIVMEFIEGKNAKEMMTHDLAYRIGRYAGLLHSNNIIHGDLTTSNFIVGKKLVLLDFGLAFHSVRNEDKAVDVKLIKTILKSAYSSVYERTFNGFLKGYSKMVSAKEVGRILKNVYDIERRGRYARVI
jgi:TP53 regulating kinase and related kinases